MIIAALPPTGITSGRRRERERERKRKKGGKPRGRVARALSHRRAGENDTRMIMPRLVSPRFLISPGALIDSRRSEQSILESGSRRREPAGGAHYVNKRVLHRVNRIAMQGHTRG